MAQQKKKTSSSSKAVKTASRSSASKNTARGQSKSPSKNISRTAAQTNSSRPRNEVYVQNSGDSLYDEILMIALIILSVIIMLSLCTPFMGVFGEYIDKLFKGLMGISAFVLPIFVSVFAVWWLLAKRRRFAAAKAIGIALFIVSFSAFFHLITEKGGSFNDIGFFKRISGFYKDATGVNGGVIGGIAGYYLHKFLGWGSYIVLAASMIIAVMLSTGKSLVTGIVSAIDYFDERKRVKEAELKARAENIRLKEEKRARRREIEDAKFQKKLHKYKKGNFNITINGDEGTENTSNLPEVEAVVFEKKEETAVTEEKEEIYDFCREVPEDDEERGLFAGEKLIEVIGEVKSDTEPANEEPEESGPVIFGVFDEPDVKPESIEDVIEICDTADESDDIIVALPDKADEPEAEAEMEILPDEDLISEYGQAESDLNSNITAETQEEPTADYTIEAAGDLSEDTQGYEFSAEEAAVEAAAAAMPKEDISGIRAETESYAEDKPAENKTESSIKEEPVSIPEPKKEVKKEYVFPPIDLLGREPVYTGGETKADMMDNAKKLEDTLHSFGVSAKVVQINKGPTVTRYELTPSQGVKVSKIVNLSDDIALNLAATGIRIEAPIPGKAAVGIEVPNREVQSVYMRTVLESEAFKNAESKLTFVLGKDIAGNSVVTDIAKMPHLLIAGATGSGKSVCINTIITSIIYKAKPEEVKLVLVDPKVVELSVYNGIPHLLIPVVTDPKKASGALNWAVKEMLVRYNTFAECHVRDIKGYNAMKREKGETDLMPQIVIIIDELADLMMAAPNEVEDSICRLAQLARAAGMHLIIATQRPSVDVITGVIKANIPSRIAFAVSSGIDSRTILDSVGAEKLLGKGDMLFYPMGKIKPVRIQGAFVTDKEVEKIVDFIKDGGEAIYDSEVIEKITSSSASGSQEEADDRDEFFDQAVELVISKEKASVSMLQRQFRIGYNRAARIVEDMERMGIVGPEEGSKPRKVLVSSLEEYKGGQSVSE